MQEQEGGWVEVHAGPQPARVGVADGTAFLERPACHSTARPRQVPNHKSQPGHDVLVTVRACRRWESPGPCPMWGWNWWMIWISSVARTQSRFRFVSFPPSSRSFLVRTDSGAPTTRLFLRPGNIRNLRPALNDQIRELDGMAKTQNAILGLSGSPCPVYGSAQRADVANIAVGSDVLFFVCFFLKKKRRRRRSSIWCQ